jgi:antitoxin YefM
MKLWQKKYKLVELEGHLDDFIEKATKIHKPIYIEGHKNSAVIVSEADFKDIQETLHIMPVPGMREAIIEARTEGIEGGHTELGW